MPLQPHEEPAAAEKYLAALTNDAGARERYLAAGHDHAAVAKEIASTTGMDVAPSNLDGIAAHLMSQNSAEVNKLADTYPAMNFIIVTTA